MRSWLKKSSKRLHMIFIYLRSPNRFPEKQRVGLICFLNSFELLFIVIKRNLTAVYTISSFSSFSSSSSSSSSSSYLRPLRAKWHIRPQGLICLGFSRGFGLDASGWFSHLGVIYAGVSPCCPRHGFFLEFYKGFCNQTNFYGIR